MIRKLIFLKLKFFKTKLFGSLQIRVILYFLLNFLIISSRNKLIVIALVVIITIDFVFNCIIDKFALKKLIMKTNHILVYLIYLLLLTAITFFSIVTLIEKPYFRTEKKFAITEDGLANKLIEFSIVDEKNLFRIKKKFEFHIIKIEIKREKSSYEVYKKYNEACELILNISKNYYDQKNNRYKVLIKKLKQEEEKIGDISNLERLVAIEFFRKSLCRLKYY